MTLQRRRAVPVVKAGKRQLSAAISVERFVITALYPEQPLLLDGLEEILRRLEFGFPSEALPLTGLPITLTRGQYLALFKEGCAQPAYVSALSRDELRGCVGSQLDDEFSKLLAPAPGVGLASVST
jgi:hypothetical protein